MIRGAIIQLSDDLYNEAVTLGRARYDNNRQHGVLKVDIEGVDPVQGDTEGVAGEMAFAQLINAGDDVWAEIRRIGVTSSAAGTDKGDATFQGRNIDVKTTRYDGGHLLVYAHKLKNTLVDGYALMTGYKGQYTFRGYISCEAITEGVEAGRFTMQSRDTYWVHQDALTDLPTRHADLHLDDDALVIDGCDLAIVGTTHDGLAVYDYQRLVQCFADDFSASDTCEGVCECDYEEQAVEWVDFNVLGALYDDRSPVIINLV